MEQQAKDIERQECDVLVIGGGPAGTTVAPFLTEKGYKVVVLEKARHPRFHIGESLLPANLPLFERMGIAEEVKAIGMVKPGAEFVSPHHDMAQCFEFADAWDKSMPYAYQVKRDEFDTILIRNAEKKGVEVHEGCKAKAVDFLPDNSGAIVRALHDDGRESEWKARFVVDASGRDTFLANRFQIKHRNPKHNSSAIYGHFAGAKRHDGQAAGNITIFWFEHGWFWFIPMMNDTTSIGMVTWPYYMKTIGDRNIEQFLMDGIAMCPALAERLKDAKLVNKVEATGNFSYVSERNHGQNYMLLGDAYAFIDPVFSSGVLLAMNSGVIGAEAIDTCLREPARAAAALKRFDALMKHGPKEFSWFIYRVTNPIMRDFFMYPKNIFRVKEALLSVLAGDIFGKTPIWRSILMFKVLYYIANIIQPKRAFMGWKRRNFNIRPVEVPAVYNA
ncbi:NAD(P)/FAD-dependent oxidoreductase [Quatrionicoccus australiensis]|uniref:NAD(P)/FAD-dependent oxidoreductase n=1 Tax=Quatrionicoccus australiensis TaxID=138118 RepID=UPI001CF97B03|nr:NAD(P)/FAD-dependent oxidoreductase [Quatrionicoccus australiensis]MCB4360034.1 tryptophan 7-halogenase [Quatrionicoccus australiensis]